MRRLKKTLLLSVAAAVLGAASFIACKSDGGSNADGEWDYVPRNDKYITFSVGFGEDKAYYYWYAEYADDSFVVTVDILDDDIDLTAENIWNRDNIEFVVQENSEEVGLAEGKSFNVMVNPETLEGSARYAVSSSEFGNSSYYNLVERKELVVSGRERSARKDGYEGYSVTVSIDYSLLGDKNELDGNLTIIPAARNGGPSSQSYWRSYTGYSCRWNKANTAVRVQKDGSFCENYFDMPDLEDSLVKYGAAVAGKTLKDNMASVQTEEHVRKFTEGANLFIDRTYLAYGTGMPQALENKSYIYAPIDAGYDFTVIGEGYVAVAVPSEGYDSVSDYFVSRGFACIAYSLPRIGYDGSGGDGITELTDYYVKWCQAGETYTTSKWCLVFFGERQTYGQDFWVANAAGLKMLDTPELINKYASDSRLWQGIPGIEAVPLQNGGTRLWATWFTGSSHEPSAGNYALYAFSDDGGKNWTFAFAIAFEDGQTNARVFDPSLFYDNDGNLWLWWNQTNGTAVDQHMGVWCLKISNPGAEIIGDGLPAFEAGSARRICDGLKMNKPTILSTGEWAFMAHSSSHQGYTTMYVSADKGETWSKRGEMYVPNALFANETAFAETVRDGKTVYIAINRTNESYNLSVSYSYDFGYTWTDGVEWNILGPSSRIVMKKLESGNLALVHHYNTANREKLCIWLSEDGGVTWPHCLILDTRSGVSYPDITQDDDGNIFVVWDYDRYGAKQILMTEITESELLAADGTIVMDKSRITVISSIGVAATKSACTDFYVTAADKRRMPF